MDKSMTRNPSALWHVYAAGEWLATEYDGYAPVSVEVNGRLHPVMYRHMATWCTRSDCVGLAGSRLTRTAPE